MIFLSSQFQHLPSINPPFHPHFHLLITPFRLTIMFFGKNTNFDPSKDIPPLEGKVILVTGANAGIGKATVTEFARHQPSQIWLAARSTEKAQLAIDDIQSQVPNCPKLTPLELDLASFESVRKAAATFLKACPRLDILVLNAGIMATTEGLTPEGYEVQMGTNHMGHALLARLLLPALKASAAASDSPSATRVVSVTSHGHTYVPTGGFRFDMLKNEAEELGPYGRYFQSKLANVLWARQMARLHPDMTVASVHPGLVSTQLMQGSTGSSWYVKVLAKLGGGLLKTPAQGALNQLWAAVSGNVVSGEYYESVGLRGQASPNGVDDELASKVWDWTEKELSDWLAVRA